MSKLPLPTGSELQRRFVKNGDAPVGPQPLHRRWEIIKAIPPLEDLAKATDELNKDLSEIAQRNIDAKDDSVKKFPVIQSVVYDGKGSITKAQRVKEWRKANPEAYAAQKQRSAELRAKKRAEK